MFSSDSSEWGTPQTFYDKLDQEFKFTLDPCSSAENHKCKTYFTKEDDGLNQDWGGHTVFMNPPYGKAIKQWLKKAYEESQKENTIVVALIPSRTDTKYFQEYCMKAERIIFVKGRLKFGGSKNSAPFPSCVVIFSSRKRIPELAAM
jgi:phage N-6-adenine-methyltransferase